jgi:hypothetical protein
VLGSFRAWLQAHWPRLLAIVALIAGVFVTLLGVSGLTSGGRGHVGHFSRRVRRILP